MEIRGFPIIPGDGHVSTMVDGCTMTITDGYGFRVPNGDQDGWHGAGGMGFADGPHYIPV